MDAASSSSQNSPHPPHTGSSAAHDSITAPPEACPMHKPTAVKSTEKKSTDSCPIGGECSATSVKSNGAMRMDQCPVMNKSPDCAASVGLMMSGEIDPTNMVCSFEYLFKKINFLK